MSHIFVFIALLLASCQQAEEVIQTTDQGRFGSGGSGGSSPDPPAPTNADLDLDQSIVVLDKTSVLEGDTLKAIFIAKDSDGVTLVDDGLTVTFEFVGDGSSSGAFAATVDEGNGIYSSIITSNASGSPNSVLARVGGLPITTTLPQLTVNPGNYYRTITLDIATDQNEYQAILNLTTSNFDYSNADSNGDDLRFQDISTYDNIDYYIETWNTSGTSTIYVKIPTSGTTSIRMYYNNPILAAGSNKEATFTYSVAKNIYYELSDAFGTLSMNVASYIDSNTITVTGSGSQVVNQYGFSTFANADRGAISVNGPISGRILSSSVGVDTIAPVSFATTVMGYPKSRGTDDWDFYNPNSTSANVTITNYDNSGNIVSTNPFVLGAGSFTHIDFDVSKFGLVESDIPILGLYYYSNANDGAVMVKGGTELLGANATSSTVAMLEDGTTGTVYYSDGSSTAFSGDKGDVVDLSGGGSQNSAEGMRVVADKNVIGVGQADSDGSESETWWPVDMLENDYMIPANSQYIFIVCNETVNLTLYDPAMAVDDTGTCSPSGNTPGRVDFGAAAGASNILAGSRIAGDANFYVYFEYSDQDETNITSWKHARSYMYPEPVLTVGSEQSI